MFFYRAKRCCASELEGAECSVFFNDHFVKIRWNANGGGDVVFKAIREHLIQTKQHFSINCDIDEKHSSVSFYGEYEFLRFVAQFTKISGVAASAMVLDGYIKSLYMLSELITKAAAKKISQLQSQSYNNYSAIYSKLHEDTPKCFTKFHTAKQLSDPVCKLIAEYAGPVPSSKDFICKNIV